VPEWGSLDAEKIPLAPAVLPGDQVNEEVKVLVSGMDLDDCSISAKGGDAFFGMIECGGARRRHASGKK
jgi:hypothetical protein